MRAFLAIAIVALAATQAEAQPARCPEDADSRARIEMQLDAFLGPWLRREPAPAIAAGTSPLFARCVQERLVERLVPELGRVVGYKAGLTSRPTQERFGVDSPVRGTLLEGMLLPDGAVVPAGFGARPLWEADLLLVVKDAGINNATTAEQALAHIAAVRPFIELPDLSLAKGEPMTGDVLTAINVGARRGVMGAAVPIEPTPETFEALRAMRVVATGADGATLATATGEATLGHPLNVVLWLLSNLSEAGIALKPGDLISVGSFTPLTPPQPGQTVTVRYEGLPGNPRVSVRFE